MNGGLRIGGAFLGQRGRCKEYSNQGKSGKRRCKKFEYLSRQELAELRVARPDLFEKRDKANKRRREAYRPKMGPVRINNPWVNFVRERAEQLGISYAEALSDPQTSADYQHG